ncbi:DegT/DnrJ/EryC1/StrS aminotransferase family protein [Synechococcus elongatus IITB4]|uniref:DegT/DnrJ/EryC1/StrS family aminotransferase n=1 Tax=Synechococcus elongatus TaxID=32046 RepID=UPI0030CAAE5D
MLNTSFAPWPSFTPEEAEAVAQVLKSNRVNYWTGQEGRQFEQEFAAWCGSQHAIAVANGTVALEIPLRALGLEPGDEVIVTPRTFLASASSIVQVGATPVFADVDPDSQNLTAATIEPLITPRTKAILCVHLAGWPCEMHPILELARAHQLAIIEDCAQAHGARYQGQSVGAIGTVAAWSFCQDKIMTTGGEGGMITTNDAELWSKMWSAKDHGKSWQAVYERQHPPGFRWLHESFGGNGRLTEMQSAIGRLQLRKMPEWQQQRLANATQIWETARGLAGLRVPEIPSHIDHAAYKAYIFVQPNALASGWSRDRIMAEINAHGVPCYSGSCSEVYLEKAFDNTGFRPKERLPVAKQLGETSLMFLCHPTLTPEHVEKTCEVITAVITQATR